MTAPTAAVATRFAFTLPRGYVDATGRVHRDGVIRLATAWDEITPQAGTITALGDLPAVDATVVERLFASDLAYLQHLYRQINRTIPGSPSTSDVEQSGAP
jgi:hypothetical protein